MSFEGRVEISESRNVVVVVVDVPLENKKI